MSVVVPGFAGPVFFPRFKAFFGALRPGVLPFVLFTPFPRPAINGRGIDVDDHLYINCL